MYNSCMGYMAKNARLHTYYVHVGIYIQNI